MKSTQLCLILILVLSKNSYQVGNVITVFPQRYVFVSLQKAIALKTPILRVYSLDCKAFNLSQIDLIAR